jgi:hypothetical protein
MKKQVLRAGLPEEREDFFRAPSRVIEAKEIKVRQIPPLANGAQASDEALGIRVGDDKRR